MSNYKFPYIPKEYYAAVMFAAKMVREEGTFNRAVKIASDYYGVDQEEVAKHLRKRQAAGQKGKKRASYHWYVIPYVVYDGDDHFYGIDSCVRDGHAPSIKIAKATSERNATHQVWKHYDLFRDGIDFGEIKEFESEEAANAYAKETWGV